MGWGKQHVGVRVAVLAVCALAAAGCAGWRVPRIDPTGERLFVPAEPTDPRFRAVPGAPQPWDPVELILVPRGTIAPVGSELVLLAGVSGADGYLSTSERVEWSIAPGGVGEFVDFDRGSLLDLFVGQFHRPHKVSSSFVVGYTSRRYLRLTRGTPTPADDVTVLRGQTWVSVMSPVEGTSYITAYSPEVFGWEQRKQTAIVHWVDAQWRLPPPAINPAGSRHVFTTMVMRQTDQSPRAGWRVKYAIVDGPPAGFAPSGATTVEVDTNAQGQASAEIFQQQPGAGTNRIAIQIIRPAQAGGSAEGRLVVGSGFTSKTWSAPGLTVRKTGPAVGSVGATLTYRIEVTNPGDMPADGVVLTDEVPDELSFMSSNPPGQLTGRAVQWQIGRLGPGQRRVFEVSLRAERQGSISTCAEAVAASGLRAKDCVTTAISLAVPPAVSAPGAGCVGPPAAAASLDVRIQGPDRAYRGDMVTFEIVITNRGATTATGIVIKDRFDPDLVHSTLQSPIKKLLGEDLPPGQSRRVGVEFRAARAGRHCQTVEITANGGIVASTESCITVLERAGPGVTPSPMAPGPTTPGPTIPRTPPGAAGRLSVTVTGPPAASVGQNVDFFIAVSNEGTQPLADLEVRSEFEQPLYATDTSDRDHRVEGEAIVFKIASLASREKRAYQIRCMCEKEASRACIRVKVTAAGAEPVQQEACLQIRAAAAPSAAGLSMTVSALHEPIAVGKELTYVIRVTNGGKSDDSQVVLKVFVPPEMIPALLGTYGPTRANTEGQTIEFLPVDRIAAGDTLTYRVRVQARKVGDVRLRAELTSRNQRQPIPAEARTTIVAAQ